MTDSTGEQVLVDVDHLRHLLVFLNRMVEQGIHVHAKCWALIAAIPDEFTAVVLDAGGGEVRLLVDRDTENYPPVGARVHVQPAEEQP